MNSFSPFAFPSPSLNGNGNGNDSNYCNAGIESIDPPAATLSTDPERCQSMSEFPISIDLDESASILPPPLVGEDRDLLPLTDADEDESNTNPLDVPLEPFQQELLPTVSFPSPFLSHRQLEVPASKVESDSLAASVSAFASASAFSPPPPVATTTVHSAHSSPMSSALISHSHVFETPPSIRTHNSSLLSASSSPSSSLPQPQSHSPSLHFHTPILRSGDTSLLSESNSPINFVRPSAASGTPTAADDAPEIQPSHRRNQSAIDLNVHAQVPQPYNTNSPSSLHIKRRRSPEADADLSNKRTKSLSNDELAQAVTGMSRNAAVVASVLQPTTSTGAYSSQVSTTVRLVPHHPSHFRSHSHAVHPSARRRLPFVPTFDQPLDMIGAPHHSNDANELQQQITHRPGAINHERRSSLSVVPSGSFSTASLSKSIQLSSLAQASNPSSTYVDIGQSHNDPSSARGHASTKHLIPTLPPMLNQAHAVSGSSVQQEQQQQTQSASTAQGHARPPERPCFRQFITFTHHCVVCDQKFVSQSSSTQCCSAICDESAAAAAAIGAPIYRSHPASAAAAAQSKRKKSRVTPTASTLSTTSVASSSFHNKSKLKQPSSSRSNAQESHSSDSSVKHEQLKPKRKPRLVNKKIIQHNQNIEEPISKLAAASVDINPSPPAALMGLAAACGSPTGDSDMHPLSATSLPTPSHGEVTTAAGSAELSGTDRLAKPACAAAAPRQNQYVDSRSRLHAHTLGSSYSSSTIPSAMPPLMTDTMSMNMDTVDTVDSTATTPRMHMAHQHAQRDGLDSEHMSSSLLTHHGNGNGMDFGSLSSHHDPHFQSSSREFIFRQQDDSNHFSFMDNFSPEPNSTKRVAPPKPTVYEYTHPQLLSEGRSLFHPHHDSMNSRRSSFSGRLFVFNDEGEDEQQLQAEVIHLGEGNGHQNHPRHRHPDTEDNHPMNGDREQAIKRHGKTIDSDEEAEEEEENDHALHSRINLCDTAAAAATTSAESTPSSSARTPLMAPSLPHITVGPGSGSASGSVPTTPMSRLHFFSSQCPTTDTMASTTTLLPSPRGLVLSRLQRASMNQEQLKQRLKKEGTIMSDRESSDEREEAEEEENFEEEELDEEMQQEEDTNTDGGSRVKAEAATLVQMSESRLKQPRSPVYHPINRSMANGAQRSRRPSLITAAATTEEDDSARKARTAKKAMERASRLNRRHSMSDERETAAAVAAAAQAQLLPKAAAPRVKVENVPNANSKVSVCELCYHRFYEPYGGGRFCGPRCARQFSINKRWKKRA